MTDNDLRQAVKKRLQRSISRKPNAKLLEELSVHHGSARIDLAVLDKILHGYELKSDSDTLERLPDQVRLFNAVFDKVTLVVGYKHAYSAFQMIPDWWGVQLAHTGTRSAIRISDARAARKNPTQDPASLAALLWREEALMLLARIETLDGYKSKRRLEIYRRLSEVSDLDTIRKFVIQRLRLRKDQPVDSRRR